jgi:hypothetical protein
MFLASTLLVSLALACSRPVTLRWRLREELPTPRCGVLPAAVALVALASGCITTTTRLVVSPSAANPSASTSCLQACSATEGGPTQECIAACPDLVAQEGSCEPDARLDRRCLESSNFKPVVGLVISLALLGVLFGGLLYAKCSGCLAPSHD